MDVRRYTPELAEIWDAFVQGSRNGTIFHTRRFLSYHPAERFHDQSLLLYEGSRLIALLSAAEQGKGEKKSLVSHPGSTFGGLVLSPKAGAAETFEVVDTLLKFLRKEGYSSLSLLRLTPQPLCRALSDDQTYALIKHGFRLACNELSSVIPLAHLTEDTLLSSFDEKTRNKVRQAERAGVQVSLSEEYALYWTILESNLGERHAVKPTHTLEEIQRLLSLFPDAIRLFGAYEGKILMAGILTVDVTERATYCKYIAQDFSFQKKRPLNLLITTVLRDCLERHKEVLDLGVAMAEEKTGLHEGIFVFKEGFGGQSVRRESWEISL